VPAGLRSSAVATHASRLAMVGAAARRSATPVRTSTLCALFVAGLAVQPAPALPADAPSPGVKEASLVTEVLAWGETVTAVRLEYTEEIDCAELTSLMPSQTSDSSIVKFHLFANRSIQTVYVNTSGKKGDVAVFGSFVFLDLGIENPDPTTYRSQVTFNPVTRTRPRLPGFVVSQTGPIATRSGRVIAPVTVSTTREISLGADEFSTFTYRNHATGRALNYHLYVPKGYESTRPGLKPLPIVVHFPSGDYNYTDWTGKYRGALFSHHDALYWSDEESQASHPAFVVTVGGPPDPKWSTTDFAASDMQQDYVRIVQRVLDDYAVDASRVYAVSLAGGSVPMWSTILANPGLFAAQISTAYDPYHAYKDAQKARDEFARLLNTLPGWFFAGLKDPTGAGVLGPADTRFKGERLRDAGLLMREDGIGVDVAYGPEGELMWNGLLRGEKARRLADEQLARARATRARHLVTLFIPGTLPVNQHWCWDATYSNAGVRDWLFAQVNSVQWSPAR
jgi:predicted peptidase